ncbi:hypothetical protein Acr_00g0096890 [Actinidia rufa]|uniref:Uncharacterized protein n=1 Tax=Actinidia rufa TaxID=165716 RepID=A0A7J0DYU2_9ERIC|nr:hypothetical protein Acr_00g0096890 [Actinidia rufa]
MLGKHACFEIQFAIDQLSRVVTAHFGLHANRFADPNFSGVDDEIAKQCAVVDSGDEVVDPMGLSITKLGEEVKELEKEVKELEKTYKEKLALLSLKECMTDTLQLKGDEAGISLL